MTTGAVLAVGIALAGCGRRLVEHWGRTPLDQHVRRLARERRRLILPG